MVGLKSSHLRQTSVTGGQPEPGPYKRLDPKINISSQSSYQQLHFHPTKLTKPQKSSPLRYSRERSGGRPDVIIEEPSERAHYVKPDFSRSGGFSYQARQEVRTSNSPLRHSKSRSPPRVLVEDSSRIIRPMPITESTRGHGRNLSFAPSP